MSRVVQQARLRLATLGEADKARCAAYRALGQPFGETDEAFLYAARHYTLAARVYRRVGFGFYARLCLLEAAECWDHLEDRCLAESLRERASRIKVAWEDDDGK